MSPRYRLQRDLACMPPPNDAIPGALESPLHTLSGAVTRSPCGGALALTWGVKVETDGSIHDHEGSAAQETCTQASLGPLPMLCTPSCMRWGPPQAMLPPQQQPKLISSRQSADTPWAQTVELGRNANCVLRFLDVWAVWSGNCNKDVFHVQPAASDRPTPLYVLSKSTSERELPCPRQAAPVLYAT